jgi:hypothetical protein
MIRHICGIAVFAILAPTVAHADCSPNFVEGAKEVYLAANDSMDNVQLTDSFQLRLRNDSSEECRIRLSATRDLGASDPAFPEFRLSGPTGTLHINSASPADVSGGGAVLVIPPHGETPVSFTVAMPVGWGMRSGDYVEQLVFGVGLNGRQVLLDTEQVRLRLHIPATSRLRFAGALGQGGAARIDLGQLSTSAPTTSAPFGVRVFSTSGYQLRFVSQSGGYLERVDGPDKIQYQMYVDGRPLNLVAGDQIMTARYTPSLGDIHPVSIVVQPDTTWHAGNYSDRVTVSVTPI